MGYVVRTYACMGSGEVEVEEHSFTLMLERDEKPKFCTVCGVPVGEIEAIPGTRAIGGSAIQQAVDGMYRALEESTAARAAMTGQKGIKVTNLNDHLREGDVAAKPLPANTVTNFMGLMAQERGGRPAYGFQTGMSAGVVPGGGRPYIVEPGKFTGPGHVALASAQSAEGVATAKQLIAAGQINKPGKK